MKRLLGTVAAIVLGTAAFIPAQAKAQVDFHVVIGSAPPPPRYEVVPAPRRGYVWAPGYWDWNDRRHVWTHGHWQRARGGYTYQRPEWRRDRAGWRLNRGGWQHAGYRGDRDRDGISNRRDRDRDGDGVPNRYDHRPNNPRRY
jgi:hypothetical protein